MLVDEDDENDEDEGLAALVGAWVSVSFDTLLADQDVAGFSIISSLCSTNSSTNISDGSTPTVDSDDGSVA